MKKLLALCAMLLLAACIDVDDFGTAWDKTTLDPAMKGSWLRVFNPNADNPDSFPAGQSWLFTEKAGAYEVRIHRDGTQDDEPVYPVKTLVIGPYTYIAIGPKKGSIIRYTFKNDTLTMYRLNFQSLWRFIAKQYPDVQSFIKEDSKSTKDILVKIKHFDDGAFDVLGNIPDNEIYWTPDMILQKVNRPDDHE